jgi:MoaA/NifB/PqqE/SkfB family radical SAM enzyme
MLWRLTTEIAPRLARFKASWYGFGKPPAPINLTLSVTNKCNSRCRSCDIWKIYPAENERLPEELTLDEIERTFRSIGPVYFFNISGGEPFLRKDLPKIVEIGCRNLSPRVVHIPTNALMPGRVEAMTVEILRGMERYAPDTLLTLKPSMDGVGDDHDWVRGIAGNYEKLLETVGRLLDLKDEFENLRVGVGTVISTMNIHKLPGIIEAAMSLEVDSYISEVAEERNEMRNLDSDITPPADAYRAAIRPFQEATARRLETARGMELVTQSMRHYYYDLTARWLEEQRQILPCYAGVSNVHLSPYGDLWSCAILGDDGALGNVKEVGYNFWKLWHSDRAEEVRAGIKRGDCDCPLANQAYANILLSRRALTTVGTRALLAKTRGALRRLGLVNERPPATPVAPVPRRDGLPIHPLDTTSDAQMAQLRDRARKARSRWESSRSHVNTP